MPGSIDDAAPSPRGGEAYGDLVAAIGEHAAALLADPPGGPTARPPRPSFDRAVATILVASGEARARDATDDRVLADLDRALAACEAASTDGDRGASVASLAPALRRARELAIERAVRTPPSGAAEGTPRPLQSPLQASRGTPSLHRDVRTDELPRRAVARVFGTLPASAAAPAPATPTQRALRRWGRDALEELALAGRLRRPREDEAWTSGRGFEARALLAVDTLATLGRGGSADERLDVAAAVDEMLHGLSIPDPGRVFASAFTLACIDTPGAASRLAVLARDARHETAGAVEDALALGSSPHVDAIVDSLLAEDTCPPLLERGLRVARRRRHVPRTLVLELLRHPDARVAAAAADACDLLAPEAAREPLEGALLAADEVALRAAASLAKLHVPSPRWMPRLAALAEGPPSAVTTVEATRLRVLLARSRDLDPTLALCARLPLATEVELLGWLGTARVLERLRAALDDDSALVRERAAWSLARITGGGLDDLQNVATDENGDPVPDPDDQAGPPPDRIRRHPPLEAAFWGDWCTRASSIDAPRLRFGRPLVPQAVLDELAQPATHQGFRRVLAEELALLAPPAAARAAVAPFRGGDVGSHAALPLDVDDWIASQERRLELAHQALAGGARS